MTVRVGKYCKLIHSQVKIYYGNSYVLLMASGMCIYSNMIYQAI